MFSSDGRQSAEPGRNLFKKLSPRRPEAERDVATKSRTDGHRWREIHVLEQRLEEFERRQQESMKIFDEAKRVREAVDKKLAQFTYKTKQESRSNKSRKHHRKKKTHRRTSSKTLPQSAASLVTSHPVTRTVAWP